VKRLILIFAFLLYVPLAWATSGDLTATFGDKNSSNVHRIEADNNGVVTFAQDTGIKYPYTSGSTNQTITAAQTGTTIVFNNGSGVAASGTMFTLPAAVVGMEYTIIADIAKWFYVKPASGEIINFSNLSANQRISNAGSGVAGDSITLFCATAGQWSVKSRIGTWANGGS
jgi:hypothetical protein